jgi:hypothetical protein
MSRHVRLASARRPFSARAAVIDDAHPELAEAVVQLLDVGEHARMVLVADAAVHAVAGSPSPRRHPRPFAVPPLRGIVADAFGLGNQEECVTRERRL